MTNTPQTEAQRLADLLEDNESNANITSCDQEREIAAELRRLDAALADELNNRDVLDKMLTQCITERDQLRAQLSKAVTEERDACAELMEQQHTWITNIAASAAIRARSNGAICRSCLVDRLKDPCPRPSNCGWGATAQDEKEGNG